MKRKVIQIAGSTQLVSLPKKWADRCNIKKGEEIEVTEEGNRLIISTDKTPTLGSIEVDATGLDRDSIMYFIRALYKNGYDEIKITFKKPICENLGKNAPESVASVITREVSRLSGVEIFTQKEDYYIIRTISEDTPKVFDTMLRRVFLLTSESIGDLIDGYEKGNLTLLETIQSKHDTVTRFVSYSQRLLNKVGYHEYKKSNTIYHILELMDTLMDLIKYNARDIIANKIKASKEGLAIYKAVHHSFNLYYDLHYNFTIRKVFELNANRYEVLAAIQNSQKKISKEELNLLVNMEQILEYILNLVNTRISLEY
jgi:phosphate uptake regulator